MSIRVVATGGTIASLPDPATGAVRSVVPIADLLASVRGLEEFEISGAEEITRVNSWDISPPVMLDVARRVARAAEDPDVDGVIVTHGTDTLEETAFLCDMVTRTDKPVVFCGSMRNGGEVSADGPRNLINAARLATDRRLRGYGTVVTLNDEVHAARWVRKLDSFRPSAFSSPGHGAMAIVRDGRVIPMAPPPARDPFPLPAELVHTVPLVKVYTGMEHDLIDRIVDVTGAGALVVEGTGWGNVPTAAAESIRRLRHRGLPVALATRTQHGGTGSHYGGLGGGKTLREWGVVEAGGLSAAKARLLMLVVLAVAGDPETAFARQVELLAPA